MPSREHYNKALAIIRKADCQCLMTCEEVSAMLTAASRMDAAADKRRKHAALPLQAEAHQGGEWRSAL